MDTGLVHDGFLKLISQRGIHKQLGITSGDVRTMRYNATQGKYPTLDNMIALLKKAGLFKQQKTYTRDDLVALLNFYKRTSQAARDEGPEYVIEKWESSKK